ncbi:MAG TPA: FtsX-like permease family protein [Vicinamibacterales bacterium]|nr:FtsX-like permease family protein [Vicinamibacterales bacterium]
MTTRTIVRIAWRNLWRNRRRTGLALTAIALSVTLVLLYDGMLRWEGDYMRETVTGPMLGHVQVHAPEWRRNRAMDRTLRDVPATVAALARDPDVAAVNPRVYGPALAAMGQEGFAVIVLGLDMSAESRRGGLLERSAARAEGRRVLMGRALAEQMQVSPGVEIAIVGQAVDGSLANDLFTVAAVIDTPVDFVNRQAVMMALEEAQALFAMPGEAHELVIYARDPEKAAALAARLNGSPAVQGAEALDWQTLAPSMVDLIELVEIAWVFVLLLVLVAAAAGVANTMLMATYERTHELGMLLALGVAPRRLVEMILLESVALGTIGSLLGTVAGGLLVLWAHQNGVDYATLTGGGPQQFSAFGMNWSLRVYPRLEWIDIVRVVVAVAITSTIASAWPAARTARLQPARALRD